MMKHCPYCHKRHLSMFWTTLLTFIAWLAVIILGLLATKDPS